VLENQFHLESLGYQYEEVAMLRAGQNPNRLESV
jgi:hypothetical protein